MLLKDNYLIFGKIKKKRIKNNDFEKKPALFRRFFHFLLGIQL